MSKKTIIGIAIGVVGSALLITTLSLLGFMYVGIKVPSEHVQKRYVVCGEAEIATHNKALSNMNREEKTRQLVSLSKEIESKANYQKDATCNFIRLHSELLGSSVSRAEMVFEDLKKSVENGSFADLRLDGLTGMDATRLQMDAFKNLHQPSTEEDPKAAG